MPDDLEDKKRKSLPLKYRTQKTKDNINPYNIMNDKNVKEFDIKDNKQEENNKNIKEKKDNEPIRKKSETTKKIRNFKMSTGYID